MDLDEVADELYELPLSAFVGTRTARAKEAKAAGDRDLAAAITALAKPSKVAWLTNQLVRERRSDIEPLLELGAGLREATATLSGEDLRTLTRQQHQLVHALVLQAKSLAAEQGERVTDEVADGVEQTLRAALADADLSEALAQARLTDKLEYAGFGGPAPAGRPKPPVAPTRRLASVPDSGQADRERAALRRTEAEQAVSAATSSARDADEAARDARTAADEAQAREQELADGLEAARAEVERLTAERAEAHQVLQAARGERDKAERAARTAATRVVAAQTVLDRLPAG